MQQTKGSSKARLRSAGKHRAYQICIVGLGYVGLPVAVEFDREGFRVIGFDINDEKVTELRDGRDPTGEVGDDRIANCEIEFTTDERAIGNARYVIIAVPTPIDDLKNPNLKFVEGAGEMIGRNLTVGTTVVLESTVYPGATHEILGPAIERASGLTSGEDFYLGYSPERIVPGDDRKGFREIVKIVSGQNEKVVADLAELYGNVVDAGVHEAPEIEVAEAAKCIENIQRDINIALVNELAITCSTLGIDTRAVLEAAGTKWNFHDYHPGLVGGHCIPVDPFYIIYESKRNGFSPKLIQQGREINDYMSKHVAEQMLKALNERGNVLQESTVLVLGLAYKANLGDIRTSAVDGTIKKLKDYGVNVVGFDPNAEDRMAAELFEIEVQDELNFDDVDAILLATPHDEFQRIQFTDMAARMADNPLLFDVMGALDPGDYTSSEIQYRRI